MALRLQRFLGQISRSSCRCMSSNSGKKDGDLHVPEPSEAGKYRNPWKFIKEDLLNVVRTPAEKVDLLPVPKETDIAIIGGAAMGSSVAYWLKRRNPEGFNVHVIEKDPTYVQAATTLSCGGIRQQFSLEENIKLSQFSAEFLQDIKEHLGVFGTDPPDVNYTPFGYLFLASEGGADTLLQNHKLQTELGANVDLMTPEQIKAKWPYMNVEDIALGTYGIENEGSFDPWLLLAAMRRKAESLGANYVKGDVVGFQYRDYRQMGYGDKVVNSKQLTHVQVRAENGVVYPMKFAVAVNCAGPWSGEIARLAGIGTGENVLQIPVPVEPRKRYVYVIHCPNGPGLDTPFVIDYTGVYLRREGLGGNYICGRSPGEEDEPETSSLDVDYDYFNEHVWPILANRIPCLEALKVRSAWAGYYDYNYFDQNLIIGNHPYFKNFFMATGCSGHGIQQSPAIGRAMMELLVDDEFKTIDLSRFSFDRIMDGEKMLERNIV